jgi:DNA-binding HxlR family transcriptional regulator
VAKHARAQEDAAGGGISSKRGPQEVLHGEAAAESLELDALVHERLRLGILCALAVNDSLSFNELKAQLGATAGNLSVHARKLEEAGHLACRKSFEGRMPRTEFRITARGRRALGKYLAHMEALVSAMKLR